MQGETDENLHLKGNIMLEQELRVERQTYTVEEAAKILGICRSVAYRKGVLPTIRIAGRRLVPKQALERMLAEEGEQGGYRRAPT
jgi:excisionase family DNA binding protein